MTCDQGQNDVGFEYSHNFIYLKRCLYLLTFSPNISVKVLRTCRLFCLLAAFLDLHLSITNGFVSSKIYDKPDDFDFDIVNFSVFGW